MQTKETEIFSPLTRTLRRNMLRWHVGHVIFCPACQAVLDCRRAVEIDVMQGGKLAKSLIVCASCFDGKVKANAEAMVKELFSHNLSVEIIDGRKFRSGSSVPRRKPQSNKP